MVNLCPLPGYASIAEFAHEVGLSPETVKSQCRRGYCRWPQRRRKGQAKSNSYRCWDAMLQRCTNPRHLYYPYYGGRGIKVCPEWREFLVFERDMGPRPSKQHTLDRIDNSKGYEPGNVRWATRREQSLNRCNTTLTPNIRQRGPSFYGHFRVRGRILYTPFCSTVEEVEVLLEEIKSNLVNLEGNQMITGEK